MQVKNISHWVFDMDGTIIDSSAHYESSITEILANFGITPDLEDMARAYKFFNPQDFFSTFNLSQEQVALAVRRLMELNQIHATSSSAFDGIENLFKFLKDKNLKISIWTGRELSSAKKILEHVGLLKYVDLCVGRTCVEKNKPYPDGLLKILSESKNREHEVLMIGDHDYDLIGAQAAGVNSVGVNWEGKGHLTKKELALKYFDKIPDLQFWAENIYSSSGVEL
jgi:HAD superfamily hydrolase (TIGR01549 family)